MAEREGMDLVRRSKREQKLEGDFEEEYGAPCSIEVTRGQSGKVGYSIKVYCGMAEMAHAVAEIDLVAADIEVCFGIPQRLGKEVKGD
jgi:hypothetical protein